MRETEPARGQSEASPEVEEHTHEVSAPRGKFTTGGGVPPVASGTSEAKLTASEVAYAGATDAVNAVESMYAQLGADKSRDNLQEIDAMINVMRAEVAKRSTLAQKIATLLPTIIAAVDAQDETVIAPIKPELELLALYPSVLAAVAPAVDVRAGNHRPKALDPQR